MNLALALSDQQLPSPQGASLLARLRSRDRTALEELAVQFSQPLTRAAYVYLGDDQSAQDAAQDALIAAWDGARRTGENTPLRPWLFGILFNCCRRQLRSSSRRRTREERAARQELLPAAEIAAKEDRARLASALAQLDEDSRAVVVLRFEQGFSVAETAQALDIPEGTVKSRLHAALEKLRALMGVSRE